MMRWYFGHTLMHSWHYKNIVFNSGTCYGISRGSLRKVWHIFETEEFLSDPQRSRSLVIVQGYYNTVMCLMLCVS